MLCSACKVEKPVIDFYASSKTRCKDCYLAAGMIYRAANIERVRAHDRERNKTPERKAGAISKAREWLAADPRYSKAYSAVWRAVKTGRLNRHPCCVCGAEKSLAHHESYDRPLDVVWYCQVHHKARHKAMLQQGISP